MRDRRDDVECQSATGPAVWYGRDLAARTDWIYRFTAQEIEEIEAAVAATRDQALIDVSREGFPLPELGRRLAELRREVVWGRGFVLLRGLPVGIWDREMVARAYWGIGCHFGDAVPQNAAGHLLGHVKDVGRDPRNPEHRIYQTSYRHLFHTDSCDLVGLLCLRPAKSGGRSAICSSTTLFHELRRRRPDLAELLCRPFHHDRKGEIPVGKGPTYELAIFHQHAGLVTTIYARDFIEAAQRFAHVPRLTDTQVEAMDLMDELAGSDDLRLDMDFQPGDIQLLHNHQILHARTSYEDWPQPERKRHLLRLWLSASDGRALPQAFSERYGEIEVGKRRGGIRVPGAELQAPLEAES